MSKMIFLNFHSSGIFDISYRQTPKFLRLSNMLESCVSYVQPQHFATFVFGFSVWFSKIEFNYLLDLLNIGFTIIEFIWFVVAKTGSKNMQIPGFYWRHGNVCLVEEASCFTDVWEHFKYLLVLLILHWIIELSSRRTAD